MNMISKVRVYEHALLVRWSDVVLDAGWKVIKEFFIIEKLFVLLEDLLGPLDAPHSDGLKNENGSDAHRETDPEADELHIEGEAEEDAESSSD